MISCVFVSTKRGGCDVCMFFSVRDILNSLSFMAYLDHLIHSSSPRFPFPTDPDDHCETPFEAYEHIQQLLQQILSSKSYPSSSKTQSLCIYDPYFCSGTVIENLGRIGFTNVYNQNEDCYTKWKQPKGQLPPFDCLVTNPPYSGEHIERLMKFVTSHDFGARPWCLLMPNWVHKKDYYQNATRHIHPFYIVPKKRYVYLPPKGFRQAKKSDVHKKSSPFVSMWYVWGGTQAHNERLVQSFHHEECQLARSKSALRDLRRKKV